MSDTKQGQMQQVKGLSAEKIKAGQQKGQQDNNEEEGAFSFREQEQQQQFAKPENAKQHQQRHHSKGKHSSQAAINQGITPVKRNLSIQIEDDNGANNEGKGQQLQQQEQEEDEEESSEFEDDNGGNQGDPKYEDTSKFRDNKSFKISPNQTPTKSFDQKSQSASFYKQNNSGKVVPPLPEINEQILQKQMREVESLIEESKKAIADDSVEHSDDDYDYGSQSDKQQQQPQQKNRAKKQKRRSSRSQRTQDDEEESEDQGSDQDSGQDDDNIDDDDDDNSQLDESERERRQRAKERVRAQMPTRRKKKFEVNYTVGRIEDGNAILLSSEHNILDVPLMLLPKNIKPGNILKFKVERNLEMERKREAEILSIQKQILEDPNFFANI